MFNTVIKRDGREVPFEAQKIENDIIKAFKATGELSKENDILWGDDDSTSGDLWDDEDGGEF